VTVRIIHGDCVAVMRTLAECSVDAIVTDPPYHLTNNGGGPAKGSDNPYSRSKAGAATGGFMGMAWDGGDVAFQVETWRQALRVLKPGGYLLAFSGTRTYHRMVVAIEDAGFEIRDQIGWAFGSGFPKSHNGEWGGTALKPAWEPICMARKPLAGTVEANWREHGTGALNIDGCRIENPDYDPDAVQRSQTAQAGHTVTLNVPGHEQATYSALGRWPANLIHDGSDEVIASFPQAPGQQGSLTGDEPSGKMGRANTYGVMDRRHAAKPRADAGSAARFFYCAKADRADRNAGLDDPGPQFKQGRTPRDAEKVEAGKRGNHHPTVKPTDLMRYLCRLVTPAGGTLLDPFMGSGSTLKAAELEGFSAIGIELDPAYVEIAQRRIAADAPLFADIETQRVSAGHAEDAR
jgi:site-specific DNA-methyltransferase (adenine-specific)